MKPSNKVVAVSLILSSMIGLSACSTGDTSLELSGTHNLADIETSSEPYGVERTVFQIEELMNKSIQVVTSENYIAVNPLNGVPKGDPFANDISKENQETINSLIAKDKYYKQSLKSWSNNETESEDNQHSEMYKFGAEAMRFNSFATSYLAIPNEAKKLNGLHSVVDTDSYWSGKDGVYIPTTAGAVAVVDGQDRYVSLSSGYASPITTSEENTQLSFANTTQSIEKDYAHLYDEMINVIGAVESWSENQSEKNNMDLEKFEKSIFASYAPVNGIKYEVKGDIASFEIKVSDKQGNVLSYRNLASSDSRNPMSGMTLSPKDSDNTPTALPYELVYEFDHEIAVASYGGKDTTIEKIVENMNSNDKLTGFDWSIEGNNPKDLTIVAKSNKNGEYKFTNRLDYPVNPVE